MGKREKERERESERESEGERERERERGGHHPLGGLLSLDCPQ